MQDWVEQLSFALGAQAADVAVPLQSDARGVIAPVFEAAQALHQNGDDVTLGDGAYDAAHGVLSPD